MSQRTFTTSSKPLAEKMGWKYSKNNLTPLGGFEREDVQNYNEFKHYSQPYFDFEREKLRYQPLFYRDE